MSVITVTIRPNGKRTEILYLPFEGKGRGYAILGDMIGASRQGQVQYAGGVWTVSRPHTNEVILGLAARYGKVKVIQHGGVEKCVESCWKKGKAENALLCECACAGRNHGSGAPYKITVGSGGPGGTLSVQASAPNEFYVP
ncbi:hypothetical protein E3N86_00100 [Cryobacterium sp. Hz7]|uniref:hypothetical protein n=1 Tax=Cryobacterium sp. Hz7 TaxID=1259166 RepID=UPI00106C3E00|nr:hypothetical protein [Cryobacterium sp. Hz7]TFB67211.1 hypothetical protein E3N86_00100 [Cryobacterium sp. Hz7]